MKTILKIIELFKLFLLDIGELSQFAGRFFKEVFKRPI
jgi:phospholipid/cholesterol/gamma-HCH transport system permease protein